MVTTAGKQRQAISLSVAQALRNGNDNSRKAEQHWQAIGQAVVQTIRSDSKTVVQTKKRRLRLGPTKDNRCWICREPLDQPEKGRLRLTCSNACRQARYRFLQGKTTWEFKREKKAIERRRSKPFVERRFDRTFFEPVFELNAWLKWYECLACGKPYEVERMKSGAPVRPYCSDACEAKTKRHWSKFLDAYERAHQQGELDKRVEERFWYDKLSPLCPRCGKPFAPNTTLHGKRKPGRPRKYCSDACRKEAYEQRWKNKHKRARVHRYRECLECGKTFDRTDRQGRRLKRFCGERCSGNFGSRAYVARRRMGLAKAKRGTAGWRIALRGAAKNKQKQQVSTSASQQVSEKQRQKQQVSTSASQQVSEKQRQKQQVSTSASQQVSEKQRQESRTATTAINSTGSGDRNKLAIVASGRKAEELYSESG